jgi:hypothetical protein
VAALRRSIIDSARRDLPLALPTTIPCGVFHFVLSGVRPCVVAALFGPVLDARVDDLVFAIRRRISMRLTYREFMACIDPDNAQHDWATVVSLPFGRHVWLACWERHRFTVSFNHSVLTEQISHEHCPRCNYVEGIEAVICNFSCRRLTSSDALILHHGECARVARAVHSSRQHSLVKRDVSYWHCALHHERNLFNALESANRFACPIKIHPC